jgi:hypothetical protein
MRCNPFPCTNPFVLFFLYLNGRRFNASGPYAVRSSFLRLGGGRAFQNVHLFALRSPLVDPNIRFFFSSCIGFLKFLPDVLRIRRLSCFFKLQPHMPVCISS